MANQYTVLGIGLIAGKLCEEVYYRGSSQEEAMKYLSMAQTDFNQGWCDQVIYKAEKVNG